MTETIEKSLEDARLEATRNILNQLKEVETISNEQFERIYYAVQGAVLKVLGSPELSGKKNEDVKDDELLPYIQGVIGEVNDCIQFEEEERNIRNDLFKKIRGELENLLKLALLAAEISPRYEAKEAAEQQEPQSTDIDFDVFKRLRKKGSFRVRISTLQRRLGDSGITTDEHLADLIIKIDKIKNDPTLNQKKPLKVLFKEQYYWIKLPYSYPEFGLTKDQLKILRAYLEEVKKDEKNN